MFYRANGERTTDLALEERTAVHTFRGSDRKPRIDGETDVAHGFDLLGFQPSARSPVIIGIGTVIVSRTNVGICVVGRYRGHGFITRW